MLCPEAKNYKFSLLLHYKIHSNVDLRNISIENMYLESTRNIKKGPDKVLMIHSKINSLISNLEGEIRLDISNCCKTLILPRFYIKEFAGINFKVSRKILKNCPSNRHNQLKIVLESTQVLSIESHQPLIIDLDKITEILSLEALVSEKIYRIVALLNSYTSCENYINDADKYNFESFQAYPDYQALKLDGSDGRGLHVRRKLSLVGSPRSVMLISHEDSFTGAPIYLNQLAIKLMNLGITVNLLAMRENLKNGVFRSFHKQFSYLYSHRKFNLGSKIMLNNWLLTQAGENALTRAIAKNLPDVLIVNSLAACDAVRVASKFGIPTILYVHESWRFKLDYSYRKDDFLWRVMETLEAANLVIFGSQSARLLWEETGISMNSITIPSYREIDIPNESEILYLKNTLREKMNFSVSDKVFLSVATFESRKRITDIVKAFRALERDDIKLILVGSNEVHNPSEVTNLIGGDFRIFQIEPTKNLDQYYALANCLIFASIEETLPLVLQEAALWKIPRIVSKYPGYQDLIPNEEFALLFTPGNVTELRQRIQDYLDKSENFDQLVNNSFQLQKSMTKNSNQDFHIAVQNVTNFQTSVVPDWWLNG
jgi:glycosyltransferase involved in cell wall biosynthesis